MNSAQFLEQEAEQAKLAMFRTILEMRQGVQQTVDLRSWIREYPWVSLGAGSVLGFAGAFSLTPGANQPWEEKWSELSARVEKLARSAKRSAAPTATNGAHAPPKKSLLRLAAGSLLKMLLKAMV